MKHVPIRLGPLALLLSVVSICLTVLAILSYSTASADLRLAQRYAQTVKTRYELEAEGMRAVRNVCKEGQQGTGGFSLFVENESGMRLSIGMEQKGGRWSITRWQLQAPWEEDTELDPVWTGD